MRYWEDLKNDEFNFDIEKEKCLDIFTFDIETTSILNLNGSYISASEYQKLDKESQEQCEFLAFCYIWQFGINDIVFYGRTFDDLEKFLYILEDITNFTKKIVFVHNLSFEFQFLISKFKVDNVFARKSRHVMKCNLSDYNIELRCTYMLSNVALKILAETYKLPVKKLTGDLDYSKIRNSKTEMSNEELKYCENDCLVVYHYILFELKKYKNVFSIPLTFTGHVRRELMSETMKNFKYKKQVRNCISVDGHLYNRLIESFARWIYTC